MSKNKNDGGPAFPTDAQSPANPAGWHGMTLRDWFAGRAMQGLLAADSAWRYSADSVAVEAWFQADAMLAEREKELEDILNEVDKELSENQSDEDEKYECPIHGLQDGPDCPRC